MSKGLSKRQKKEVHKFALANWKVLLAIFLILVVLCVVAYYLGWFEKLKNYFDKDDEPVMSVAGGHETRVERLEDLQVNFLDIGQGDCIIIELPDGKNMIIDSGDGNSDQTVIRNFTTENNIETFDYLLLTHQDADHVANMDWVLENYKVNYVFRPNNYSKHDSSASLPSEFNPVISDKDAVSTTKAYADFMVAAYNEGCVVEVFNKDSDFTNYILCGDEKYSYTFNFLTPTANKSEIIYEIPNDYSPILTLEYAGKKVMFTGDAELDVLDEYVSAYGDDINVDVLKVGHHGSNNATSSEFLSCIDPEFAVIQCGQGNSYGHPHASVLSALKNHDAGIAIYRNDCNGGIELSISLSGSISWDFERSDMSYNDMTGDEFKNIVLSAMSCDSSAVVVELGHMWYSKKESFVM